MLANNVDPDQTPRYMFLNELVILLIAIVSANCIFTFPDLYICT